MKSISVIIFATLATMGCTHHPEYELGASTEYIREIQILDPGAPERNDGITTGLDGKYGEKVIKTYQKSSYEVKSARDIKHIKSER